MMEEIDIRNSRLIPLVGVSFIWFLGLLNITRNPKQFLVTQNIQSEKL